MTLRRHTLPHLALILAILPPLFITTAAQAKPTCKQIPGIKPEIARFIDELAAAQAAGQGTLPLTDVFFGFTEVSAADQQKLKDRITVNLTRQDDAGGDYVNQGAEIEVEGLFAADPTWVRMPPEVRGRYAFGADGGVTLMYDPKHTVELGERHIGMRFFKPIHHTVITRDGLAFYLDKNAGPDPDRCYHAVE